VIAQPQSRDEFVNHLAAIGRIVPAQRTATKAFAATLDPATFTAWAKTYAEMQKLEDAEAVLRGHRAAGMPDAEFRATKSFATFTLLTGAEPRF
jgi:hypothetical protein